jgi:hypothetical protein
MSSKLMWPSDRTGDKSQAVFGGKLLRDFARQFRSFQIDLSNPVPELEFGKHNARAAKCVGLDYVAPYGQEIRMDIANNVRTAQDKNFGAVLLAPIVIQRGIALLDVGSHRTVVDHDTLADGLEKISHCVSEIVVLQN